jgi:hypothetical protein
MPYFVKARDFLIVKDKDKSFRNLISEIITSCDPDKVTVFLVKDLKRKLKQKHKPDTYLKEYFSSEELKVYEDEDVKIRHLEDITINIDDTYEKDVGYVTLKLLTEQKQRNIQRAIRNYFYTKEITDIDNYYLHFTCEKNVISILTKGFLSEYDPTLIRTLNTTNPNNNSDSKGVLSQDNLGEMNNENNTDYLASNNSDNSDSNTDLNNDDELPNGELPNIYLDPNDEIFFSYFNPQLEPAPPPPPPPPPAHIQKSPKSVFNKKSRHSPYGGNRRGGNKKRTNTKKNKKRNSKSNSKRNSKSKSNRKRKVKSNRQSKKN